MIFKYLAFSCCMLIAGCAEMPPLFDTRPATGNVRTPAALGGIYEGSISLPNGERTTVAVVTLDNGETRLVAANGMQMALTLHGPLNRLQGSGRLFASNTSTNASDKVLADGSTVAPVTIEAALMPRTLISGRYASRGGSGRFDARYLPLYERDSSLAKLAGTYRSYKQGSSFVGSIDQNGRLNGNDDRGAYEGQLSIISPANNVYRAYITYRPIGQAPIAITGVATLNDFEKVDDNSLLQMQLSNEERHFFSQIRRVR